MQSFLEPVYLFYFGFIFKCKPYWSLLLNKLIFGFFSIIRTIKESQYALGKIMTTQNVKSKVSVFEVDTNCQHALSLHCCPLHCTTAMAISNSCILRADRCPHNISFPCHQLQTGVMGCHHSDWIKCSTTTVQFAVCNVKRHGIH